MKKIYFILAAAAMFLAVDANAQLQVGAGYNHGTRTERIADEDDSEDLDGFYLEATYGLNLVEKGWGTLALEPGVRFTYLGDAESDTESGYKVKSAFNETYLDIPVHVKYSYDLGTVKLLAFAGPVFSMGLTSVLKTSVKGEGVNYVGKHYNYSGKTVVKGEGASSSVNPEGLTDYGRFDIKLGLGVGATFMEKFNVKVGYNIGMLNRYTGEQLNKDYKYKMHTGVFYAGIGFSF